MASMNRFNDFGTMSTFTFLTRDEMETLPRPNWLVEGIIPASHFGTAVMLAGKEGSTKSFLAVDLACHIALGRDWCGHTTASGGIVLYVSGERSDEVLKRVEAWEATHNYGAKVDRFRFLPQSVDLMDSDAVGELIADVSSNRPGCFCETPRLVVIDTLASCKAGVDENGFKDESLIAKAIDRIQRDLQTVVVLIHHLNKGEKPSPRGSNAVPAHCDAVYHVYRKGKVTRMKTLKANRGVERSIALHAIEVETRDGTTLVFDRRWEEAFEKPEMRDEPPVALPARPTEPAWAAALREAKGLEEWSLSEATEITRVAERTLLRYLDSDLVRKTRRGHYCLSS